MARTARVIPECCEPRGVSVDLARELGRHLSVPVELVTFESAGNVVASQKTGSWDLDLLAVDPARATDLRFTARHGISGARIAPPGAAP